ncbi:3-oxoadipate enol-lactonase [Mycobacterium frederiksbergense]|uniref:3-oxoadipate enol-lactonase n=1 Tax=Mycolicibacterium frederiksbergense TaxID=117567 RepID=A0ABT6L6Q0_9MYCO|nr:alpha/beta hydrolase [Mycolicibacterium frederiksbergense]MDH6198600.1 3-oxoadipate enol-lactonase [Mycolicibacterium frederiksbergense]
MPPVLPTLTETGAGEPVVFLHSMAGSSTSWSPQFESLSGEFHCVAWDMPGYGSSAPADQQADMSFMADLLRAALDERRLDQRVHLVGLSVGGMIAQHFAIRNPERVASLAILDSSAKFGNGASVDPEQWLQPMLSSIEASPLNEFCHGMVHDITAPNTPDPIRRSAVADMSRATKAGLRLAAGLIARHDASQELALITVPTLVIVGELDRETPVPYSQTITELIAGATLEVLPGTGHLSNIEAPEAVNRALHAHLRKALV